VSEKELSISYRKPPMDVLLRPPEELDEEDVMGSEASVESSYISSRTISTVPVPSPDVGSLATPAVGPLARQRGMRENSDFIRIAVMEMMMRKNGKLDDKMPGRARWALPPRKPSNKAYEIGEGGVPVRWIPTTISYST
jgi:hypothetical protein